MKSHRAILAAGARRQRLERWLAAAIVVAVIVSGGGRGPDAPGVRVSNAAQQTPGADVSGQWHATGDWPGVFLTITFSVDADNTTVRKLKIVFNCADKRAEIERGEGLAAEPDRTFSLSDGRLEFALSDGSLRGSGELSPDGTATGRVESRVSLRCEGQLVRVEGMWKGQRVAGRI